MVTYFLKIIVKVHIRVALRDLLSPFLVVLLQAVPVMTDYCAQPSVFPSLSGNFSLFQTAVQVFIKFINVQFTSILPSFIIVLQGTG